MRSTISSRKISLHLVGSLLAVPTLACGSGKHESVGTETSRIQAGVDVTNNDIKAVKIELPVLDPTDPTEVDIGTGSGVVLSSQTSTEILTAAHVVVDAKGHLPDPASVDVGLGDQKVKATTVVAHPSFLIPVDQRGTVIFCDPNEFPCPVKEGLLRVRGAMDLALVISQPLPNVPFGFQNVLNPLHPDLLLGQHASVYGYGFLDEPLRTGLGTLRTFSAGIGASEPVLLFGSTTSPIGFSVGVNSTLSANSNFQHIAYGDSGGPTVITDANGGTDIVGVNSFTRDPSTGDLHSYAASVFGYTEWIEDVLSVKGSVFDADWDGFGVPDQLIVKPGAAQWLVHVEFGQAHCFEEHDPICKPRARNFITPPVSSVVPSFVPKTAGLFDDNISLDTVGLLDDGRAIQILNPAVDPSARLLSDTRYSTVKAVRLNGDDLSDLEAELITGGKHHYFGTAVGLVGPYAPGASCRNGGKHSATKCGLAVNDGSCSCALDCGLSSAGCCQDQIDVCTSAALNQLFEGVSALLGVGTLPVTDTIPKATPVVNMSVGASPVGLGVFLNKDWILAPQLDTSTGIGDLTVAQKGGSAVTIAGILRHPEAELSLLRVKSSPDLPSDYQLPLYPGTAHELAAEPSLQVFGTDQTGLLLRSLQVPQGAAIVSSLSSLTAAANFSTVEIPSLLSDSFAVPNGSPVLSRDGFLASIASGTTTETVGFVNAQGDSDTADLVVHDQVPLFATNRDPSDVGVSARYWIEHTMARSALRDFDDDAQQDLWVFAKGTTEFLPGILVAPFDSPGSASSARVAVAGPSITTPGNWRLIARAKLGSVSVANVWRDVDSGDFQVWRMSSPLENTGVLTFNVDPTWEVDAAGDINGDGIADLVWTNSLLDAACFWLMNDIDSFPDLAALSQDPGQVIAYGQFFDAVPVAPDVSDGFTIVAADHFESSVVSGAETGPEQAAVDLVWQEINGTTTIVTPMAFFQRPCNMVNDERIRQSCATSDATVFTYEQTRRARAIQNGAFWRLSGTGDFNNDGRVDLVWHARGTDAPESERGKVEIWYARADGDFDRQAVLLDGVAARINPAEEEVLVR